MNDKLKSKSKVKHTEHLYLPDKTNSRRDEMNDREKETVKRKEGNHKFGLHYCCSIAPGFQIL